MIKFVYIVIAATLSSNSDAGEINFSGLFDSLGGNKITQQREIESKLESDINNFRSVLSSRVIIPVADNSRIENIWSNHEAQVLPVEVILKLKKRRRLSKDEYTSIHNLINSSLSSKNQIVQAIVRDEEGYEWSEEKVPTKDYFKATSLEHEIWDRLIGPLSKEVAWAQVHVSEQDGSCKISGNYLSDSAANMEIRRDVMGVLGALCTSARLTVSPFSKLKASSDWVLWFERSLYILLGFSLWGLAFAVLKYKNKTEVKSYGRSQSEAEDAIILTQMVDRSPDQAAKWMVRALLSESKAKTEENKEPQIFDQSP